jgi:diacylglycerol kinase family enzyme
MSKAPTWTIQFGDEPAIETPTRMLSVLLARREGNFTLAPEALHDDGLFDILHVGAMSRFEMLHWLPRVVFSGPPKDHPLVLNRRCHRVRVTSHEPLIAHLDGEMFCVPADCVCELTAELLPARLRVQVVEPLR